MANLDNTPIWDEGVRQLEVTDDCEASVFNVPFGQLTHRTAKVKEMVESEAETRAQETGALTSQVQALQGRGGPVPAYDFGTDTPDAQSLTLYACESIWGAGGTFVWDGETPALSTYTIEADSGSVTHAAGEIFNSTWVRNTYNNTNHRIVLTNTPDTDPPVFAWTDVGFDTVGV